MYIPIIILSSAIDIPEASPIIDDEEDTDEGVRDEVVEDNKDKDERAMNKDVWDEGAVRDEDEAVEIPMFTIKYIITTQMNIHCTCH